LPAFGRKKIPKGGIIPLFGKEGLGEIFRRICLLYYGLVNKPSFGETVEMSPTFIYHIANKILYGPMLYILSNEAPKRQYDRNDLAVPVRLLYKPIR